MKMDFFLGMGVGISDYQQTLIRYADSPVYIEYAWWVDMSDCDGEYTLIYFNAGSDEA